MLLLQEGHFVLITKLDLPEISLQICDVFENSLEQVVETLGHLMLKVGALTPEDLPLTFVLVEVMCQLHGILLDSGNAILDWLLARVEAPSRGIDHGLVHPILFYLIKIILS